MNGFDMISYEALEAALKKGYETREELAAACGVPLGYLDVLYPDREFDYEDPNIRETRRRPACSET